MTFRFKLQSLLSHRKFIEDTLHREFVYLGERVSEAKQIEKHLQRKKIHLSEELKKNMQKPRPMSESSLYVTYLDCLTKQIGIQKRKIHQAEKEKYDKQVELLKAAKKRKMLERLKDTHAERYHHLYLKHEQDVTNEVGIQQYNHKTNE